MRKRWSWDLRYGSSRRERLRNLAAPPGPSFDPFDYFGARLVDFAWAPYEGPNSAPANVSASKRTGSIAYGDVMPEISNYAGGDFHTEVVSTGVTLVDGGAGPDHFLAAGSSSYQQLTSPITLNDDLSLVHVYARSSLTLGGYMYQHDFFSPSALFRTASPYEIDFFNTANDHAQPTGDLDWHVSIQHVDTANTKTDYRIDGAIVDTAAGVHDYGAGTTKREMSGYTGSTRWRGKQVGWFKIRDLTEEEAGLLETWIAAQTGITLAGP